MMIRTGITGIGGYGRVLLDLLLEEQRRGVLALDAAVVSFPEQDAEHLDYLKRESPHTRIYGTLEEAARANGKLDLMVLPVAIGAHRELAVQSLEAGWNVLVEKPLAGSVEDAQVIIDAADRAGRFAAVGFQDMYAAHVRDMKMAILSGKIGAVQSVRCFGIWGRPLAYYCRSAWAGKLRHNGQAVFDSPFNNGLSHYLNLALFLAGSEPAAPAMPVSVCGRLRRAHAIESCDTAELHWQTESGADIAVFFSHASSHNIGPELRVQGSRGEIHWRMHGSWELREMDKAKQRFPAEPLPESRRNMVRQVVRRVTDPSADVFMAHQALAQVRAVALAHERISIETVAEDVLHRFAAPDDKGVMQDWVEIRNLEEEARDFFDWGVPVMTGEAVNA